MILAASHLTASGAETAEFVKQSRLMKHFREFDKHVKFVVHLVSILKVTDLTQENVSCLNTSLVILMLARRDERLPRLLSCLLDFGNSLLINMRSLLQFWQEHYLHKDKDCSTLEKSSLIPFSFWKSTVDQLVSEDPTQRTAILHYVQDGESSFTRRLLAPSEFPMDTDEPF